MMNLKDVPIQRKLMSVILLTCSIVLLLICSAYIVFEYYSFKRMLKDNVSTLGAVIASNSSAALAFDSPRDATEILRALEKNRQIVAACLYDENNRLFATYNSGPSLTHFPQKPVKNGYYYEDGYLVGFEPVLQSDQRLGTLFIKSDLTVMYAQMRHFIVIAVLLIIGCLAVAWLLSVLLQKSISQPILALEQTAKIISGSKDYSIRAVKQGNDEIGSLTGTFNEMLSQIQSQNEDILSREEHLRQATEAAELGTFDMNIQEGNITWDSRSKELLGIYRQATDESGKFVLDGLNDDESSRIFKILNNVLSIPDANGNYDLAYQTTGFNNKVRWIRVKGKVFFNNEQVPERFLGAVIDITSQKQEQLRKNDFIAIISHELKTPLTSIKSYLQILLAKAKKENDGFEVNALSRAEAHTTKMTSMIKDFLSLARIEEGKLRIDKTQFDLNLLFEEIIAEASFITSSHTIYFQQCDEITVFADRDKIAQVLLNLIGNAVKYSSPGTNITVSCTKKPSEVTIRVKDEGIGINPEDQKKLFSRFHRIENEKMKTVSGFGIGLYLVSEILRYHDSKIFVTSEEGKGSTFYFSLDTVDVQQEHKISG